MRGVAHCCILGIVSFLLGCGFHLRGKSENYRFPFLSAHLDCDKVLICSGLQSTIKHEALTELKAAHESAEVTIVVNNEQTSRDALNYNSVGQIASYILTYQISLRLFDAHGQQLGQDIVVKNQMTINYNNSLILSAEQQEANTWEQIHQNVINIVIRRLVYFPLKQMSVP